MRSLSTAIIAAALAAAAFNALAIWSSTIDQWKRSPEIAATEPDIVADKVIPDARAGAGYTRPRRIRIERLNDAARRNIRVDFSFGIVLGGAPGAGLTAVRPA